jgi:uncharacterized OsmC-like protein
MAKRSAKHPAGPPPAVNRIDRRRLAETVEEIKARPALARFRFRANNRWLGGGHSVTTVKDFDRAGEADRSRPVAFDLHADEPPALLGGDQGANPIEHVLAALAACLTTSLVYHAAARGIEIEEVESRLEGDLDVRGFFGLATDVRKGYERIRVKVRVKSDAPAEQLRAFMQDSPVYDMLANPVPISLELEKK